MSVVMISDVSDLCLCLLVAMISDVSGLWLCLYLSVVMISDVSGCQWPLPVLVHGDDQ